MRREDNNSILEHARSKALMAAAVAAAAFPRPFIAAETGVGQAIDNGAAKVAQEIAHVYCGSLWILFLIIDVVILAVSKNEKVLGAAKVGLIIIIVAYIVLRILGSDGGGVIGSSMDTISGWFSG